jgi:hypothetical protein
LLGLHEDATLHLASEMNTKTWLSRGRRPDHTVRLWNPATGLSRGRRQPRPLKMSQQGLSAPDASAWRFVARFPTTLLPFLREEVYASDFSRSGDLERCPALCRDAAATTSCWIFIQGASCCDSSRADESIPHLVLRSQWVRPGGHDEPHGERTGKEFEHHRCARVFGMRCRSS